jgi:drug/metabolite transporter (DMT)-like permease
MNEILLIGFLISFLWGLSPILTKTRMDKIDYEIILLMDIFLYFILIFIYLLYKNKNIKKSILNIDKSTLFITLFAGIFCTFIPGYLYVYCLKETDNTPIVCAIVGISPLFTLLISYLYLKEKITLSSIIGILLIVLGIVIISYNLK